MESTHAYAPIYIELNRFRQSEGAAAFDHSRAVAAEHNRPTLVLDQEDELLELAFVEVGDGAERHP